MQNNEIAPSAPRNHVRGFPLHRRAFLQGMAGGGLALAGGTMPAGMVHAQAPATPTAPAPAAGAPPGLLANEAVMKTKIPQMKMHSDRPLTASAPAEFQHHDVTPVSAMFVRNNLTTPVVNANNHVLRLTGLVDKAVEIGLDDLKKLPLFTTQAMLECAGSGRGGFNPVPRGTPWSPTGGMGCPRWTGVRLRDVLKLAGVKGNALHVAFSGVDLGAIPTAPKVIRSVPIAKAMDEYSMIAIGMNDAALDPVHGFPMRSMIPGWVGSASIKWLDQIELLGAPFQGVYMDDSYRLPRITLAPGERMPADSLYTEAWVVKSIITSPAPSAKFKLGQPLVFQGKAWAGDQQIKAVEVSFDEGVSWRYAELKPRGDKYAWRGFATELRPDKPGFVTCLARACDDAGNVQPMATAWNPLGYFWNGVHRVGVRIEA